MKRCPCCWSNRTPAWPFRISNRAYAMSTGSVVLTGNSKDLMNDDRIKAAYLGGEV